MNADKIFEDFLKSKPTAGRGKKLCPECNSYSGVRKFECECGYVFQKGKHKFTKKEKDAKIDQATEEEKLYAMCIGAPGGILVYSARGCPSMELNSITPEAVSDYCNLVVHEGIQEGRIYTIQAIKGYLQHQFGYNSGEYMSACVLVDKWCDKKMGVDSPSDYGTIEEGNDPWA